MRHRFADMVEPEFQGASCATTESMIKAGIRELRQNVSVLIRRVIEGETIEVIQRGRPVARIVPVHGRSVLDRMIADGRAAAAKGDLLDVKPFSPVSRARPLSETLTDLRASER